MFGIGIDIELLYMIGAIIGGGGVFAVLGGAKLSVQGVRCVVRYLNCGR